jgi:hypothetical protein
MKFQKNAPYWLALLICIGLKTAFAGEKMEILIKPNLSEAEVRARYGRVDVEKSNNAAFHFSIVRPRDSEQFAVPDEAPTPDNNRVMIALFGKTGEAYGVEVDAVLLPREMSAADWLAVWLDANGYRILNRQITKTPVGDLADIIAAKTVDGVDFLYRMKTYKDGPYIYLVQGRATRGNFARHEDEFAIAMERFALLHPTGEISAEPLKTYRVTQPHPASFKLPASWAMSPDPVEPPGGTSLRFKAEDASLRRVYGNLSVVTLPRAAGATPDEIEAPYLKALSSNGVSLTGGKLKPDPAVGDLWSADRPGLINGGPIDVVTRVHRSGQGWLFFGMLMSDPEVKVLALQASARRALEIAENSFQPE